MATGVTLQVIEAGGNFEFIPFYEQVNSVVINAGLTHNENLFQITMDAENGRVLIGYYEYNGVDAYFDLHGYMTGNFGGDANTALDVGLVNAVMNGESGTQAVQAAFAADDTLIGNIHNDTLGGLPETMPFKATMAMTFSSATPAMILCWAKEETTSSAGAPAGTPSLSLTSWLEQRADGATTL